MLPKYLLIITFLLSTVSCSQFLKFEDLCKVLEIGKERYPLEQFLESKGYKYVDYYEDKFNKIIKYSYPYKDISQDFLLSVSIISGDLKVWYSCFSENFYAHFKEAVITNKFIFITDSTQKYDKSYVMVYKNEGYMLWLIKKPYSNLTEYSVQLVKIK